MRLGCPICKAEYNIDERRLPPRGANVRCPKCKGVFPVVPPGADVAETVSMFCTVLSANETAAPSNRFASSSLERSSYMVRLGISDHNGGRRIRPSQTARVPWRGPARPRPRGSVAPPP